MLTFGSISVHIVADKVPVVVDIDAPVGMITVVPPAKTTPAVVFKELPVQPLLYLDQRLRFLGPLIKRFLIQVE